jgi:hypothetical protein
VILTLRLWRVWRTFAIWLRQEFVLSSAIKTTTTTTTTVQQQQQQQRGDFVLIWTIDN